MSGFHKGLLLLFGIATLGACGGPEKQIEDKLTQHVIFLSNFEKGVDALSSRGEGLAEFDGARSNHNKVDGITDGYLEFREDAGVLGYEVKDNFPYSRSSFSGGVSFWLSADPAAMDAGFPEPFHVGKKVGESLPWDDAVLFVDFTKPPRALRFGCYSDKSDEISDEMVDRRVIRLDGVSWKKGEWHHVVITWKNFNSGAADAEWALFVDGKEVGRKSGLRQDLTWNTDGKLVRFNHHKYTGAIDDIAIFDTMLTAEDAAYLFTPKIPINKLLKKDY